MKIKTMVVTCEAVPTQLEGELEDGRFFYFRERHGHWSFGVGATVGEAVENSFAIRGGRSGSCEEFMPVDVAKRRAKKLAKKLEPVS